MGKLYLCPLYTWIKGPKQDYLNDNKYTSILWKSEFGSVVGVCSIFTNKALKEKGYMTQVVKEGLTPIDNYFFLGWR